jgi:hypothetical protein
LSAGARERSFLSNQILNAETRKSMIFFPDSAEKKSAKIV